MCAATRQLLRFPHFKTVSPQYCADHVPESSQSHFTPAPAAVVVSRRAWIGICLLFAIGFVLFWVRTTPVRLANSDDVDFQKITSSGIAEKWITENALTQGRFYQATPVFVSVLTAPYKIVQPWAFSFLRTAAFFGQVGLAAWLLARVTGNPAWGATLALTILCTLHIPLTYYLLLSYPFDWLGFCAVLAALHFHYSHLARPRLGTGVLTGVCFLTGCLMHEIFVLFLPLFAALTWLRGDRRWIRANLAPLTVAFAYAFVYLLFARLHPTTYQGTQFSFNLVAAFQVVVRQIVGNVPGFELIVGRLYGDAVPLLRSGEEVIHTLLAVPRLDLLVGLVEASAATGLLLHAVRQPPVLVRGWPWAAGFAVFLNLPLAFSAKYHVFILCREFPYAYVFYSFFFMVLAFLSLVVWVAQLPVVRNHGRILGGLAGSMILAASISAAASNHRVLQILTQRFN